MRTRSNAANSRGLRALALGYRQVPLGDGTTATVPEVGDISDLIERADRLREAIRLVEERRQGLVELAELGIPQPLRKFDELLEEKHAELDETLVWLEELGFAAEPPPPPPVIAGIYQGEITGILRIRNDETIVTVGPTLIRLEGQGPLIIPATGTDMRGRKVPGSKVLTIDPVEPVPGLFDPAIIYIESGPIGPELIIDALP